VRSSLKSDCIAVLVRVCVAVKFSDDTYEVSATRCRRSLTIVELRKRVADKLNIPCSVVQILQHGNDARRRDLSPLS